MTDTESDAPEQTESERWFDEYLLTHGYTWTVEPDLGVRTRPDRLIDRAGVEAICEVKEFTTDAMQKRWPEGGSQIGSFVGADEWIRNVRRAITDKAKQLAPLAGDPRPLVIVLANPNDVVAEITGDKLIEAMYGDLQVTFRIDPETGAASEEPQWTLGEGGRLAEEKAPWVSAVVGLHRGDYRHDWEVDWLQRWEAEHGHEVSTEGDPVKRWVAASEALKEALPNEHPPEGDYFYVHVVEAISEDAVPLPRNIFDGERDKRWIVDREADGIVPLLDDGA